MTIKILSKAPPAAPPGFTPEQAQWIWDIISDHYKDLLTMFAKIFSGEFEFIVDGNNPGDDGNWLLIISGDDFIVQRRESAAWVDKWTFEADGT